MDFIKSLAQKIIGQNGQWTEQNISVPPVYEHFRFNQYEAASATYLLIVSARTNEPIENYYGIYNYVARSYQNIIPIVYIPLGMITHLDKERPMNYITSTNKYCLSGTSPKASITNDYQYTKTTQLVIKYFLFVNEEEKSTRSIARFLNVSNVSIMRALDFLCYIGAIIKTGFSTSTVKYEFFSKKAFFKAVEDYLIRPYKRKIISYVKKEKYSNKLHSGDYALEMYTDLGGGKLNVYAVDKKTFKEITNDKEFGDKTHTYQEFIYNPFLFAKDGSLIDPLDAYIIAKKDYIEDERIKEALKQLKEIIINDYAVPTEHN